jgi:hypothetical protein
MQHEEKACVQAVDPGCAPPLENGRAMPAGPVKVTVTRYVRRRIADGSVVVVDCPKAKAPAVDGQEEG